MKYLIALAIFLLSGCKTPQKPNVVFILTEQWRASALRYMGDPNVKTPHLDDLARNSVNFVNAVSVSPVCTPHFPHHSAPKEYMEMYPSSEITLSPNVPEELHENILPDGEAHQGTRVKAPLTTPEEKKWPTLH